MSRTNIMLCYPFEESRLAKWEPPYIVQPKLDGIRCRYVRYEGGSLLLSSEENVIFSVPHIKNFLDSIPELPELDGELYCHGIAFEDIVSITSREVNIHSGYENIQYHIFDIADETMVQVNRTLTLTSLGLQYHKNSPIKIVPYYIANTLEDVMRIYDQILNEGYEGIVVRNIGYTYLRKRSTGMMKFKPKKTDIYRVVGYKEEVSIEGVPKGTLGALICVGDEGTQFSVGSGFTQEQRQKYWDIRNILLGKYCTVSYQHTTSKKGVPRFPVFVSVDPT